METHFVWKNHFAREKMPFEKHFSATTMHFSGRNKRFLQQECIVSEANAEFHPLTRVFVKNVKHEQKISSWKKE